MVTTGRDLEYNSHDAELIYSPLSEENGET